MALLFDTYVQKLKYQVLTEVARLAYAEQLTPQRLLEIAGHIIPEGKPNFRCCIYKERAIINERVSFALGGEPESASVVGVLPIACDECPVDGIQVTAACRGCLAHRCMAACPKDAITVVNHRAQIDKTKCVECGKCLSACPYSAIVKNIRPCVAACKPKAIRINKESGKAMIDDAKCVSCGACVYQCPFGAITDKSAITGAISLINGSRGNTAYHVYAVVAPSIASQYADVTAEQACAGIRRLGFHAVIEAAWGADMTAWLEAKELREKGFLLSSCCPSFVEYVRQNFPDLADHISSTLSPMAQIGKWLHETDPGCRVVFIGPCISKKSEAQHTEAAQYVDCALTFEEMQAMFSAREIDPSALAGEPLDNASYFGRIFARSGGLAAAVEQALTEQAPASQGAKDTRFQFQPLVCSGLPECRTALLKAQKGLLKENFIEGMACEGGCIGGPACLRHTARNAAQVDAYGRASTEENIAEATRALRAGEAL